MHYQGCTLLTCQLGYLFVSGNPAVGDLTDRRINPLPVSPVYVARQRGTGFHGYCPQVEPCTTQHQLALVPIAPPTDRFVLGDIALGVP